MEPLASEPLYNKIYFLKYLNLHIFVFDWDVQSDDLDLDNNVAGNNKTKCLVDSRL